MRSNLAENLQPDPRINLALGTRLKGRDCTILKNRTGYWENLLSDVFSSTALRFTRAQYLAKTDEERDELKKNLPYFVGGPTEGLRGDDGYLQARSFITIDIDSAPPGVVEEVRVNLEKLGITALIHQSLNHSESAPRIRVIVPLLYEVDPDDYSLAARILASKVLPGLGGVDTCSFKASQVMLLPVHCIDDEPVCIVTSGEFYDALQELQDWQGEIPQTPSEIAARKQAAVSSGSRKESRGTGTGTGVIGAFCQAFTPREAIERFVTGFYEPAKDGRLRRAGSKSMEGGLVFLDDRVYSHHSDADPLARPGDDGKVHAHNAFDAVRIHKGQTASEMVKWAAELPEVAAILEEQALNSIPRYVEGQKPPENDSGEDWRNSLDRHPKTQRLVSSLNNVSLVLGNHFRGCIATNLLDGQIHVRKPFLGIEAGRLLDDTDNVFLRQYLEKDCKLPEVSKRNLEDAVLKTAREEKFHPIREYLDGLEWDGKKRIASWTELFGAEQTTYTREAGVLTLLGAVARVFEPGMKFDSVMVIVSAQGAGKGRLLKALGGPWYKELSSEFHDANRMIESTLGGWIVEMAELQGVGRADRCMLKSYITRTNDAGRLAYGRGTQDRPRQFVLIGTSNESDFLADETGERRWWPIEGSKSMEDPIRVPSQAEVDQLWAEAVVEYRQLREKKPHGDLPLYLSKEAQKEHEAVVGRFKAQSEVDLLAQSIAEWADPEFIDCFTIPQVWSGIGGKAIPNKSEATRLGNALKLLEPEWVGRRENRNGKKVTVYYRTSAEAAARAGGDRIWDNLVDNLDE